MFRVFLPDVFGLSTKDMPKMLGPSSIRHGEPVMQKLSKGETLLFEQWLPLMPRRDILRLWP
jgi:hypothetical protein